MQRAARRPLLTVAAVTTAGALALSPVAVPRQATPVPIRTSSDAVALTDAWYDLLNNSLQNVEQIGRLFVGANTTFPLPDPTIFLAPVATQLVLNPMIYGVQLLTGNAGQIPGEIAGHLTKLRDVAVLLITELPAIVFRQLQAPFLAAQLALNSITAITNVLTGLLEAPAVFLDALLNSNYGLIGGSGPIAVSVLVRNLIATALETPLPSVVLPFKKAGGASVTTKTAAAATVTPKTSAPSGTASSARSKPKASSSTAGKRKATATKADNNPARGHSKRG